MESLTFGCIGCGVMGSALVKAVAKTIPSNRIFLTDVDSKKAEDLAKEIGCTVVSTNKEIIEKSDYVLLAVKPAFASTVLSEVREIASKQKTTFISTMAGVKLDSLADLFTANTSGFTTLESTSNVDFIRIMPNLPATVGQAMIALCAKDSVQKSKIEVVKELLSKAGVIEQVDEKLMDCVTGISGSGSAYGFMFIEAMADAAVMCGMPRKQAYVYAAQTLKGAASMVLETQTHPAVLKDNVCSPSGTTIEGVYALEKGNFRATVMDAIIAGAKKSEELGKKK